MKFFESITRGRADQVRRDDEAQPEMDRSHVSKLVDRLSSDEDTGITFNERVRDMTNSPDERAPVHTAEYEDEVEEQVREPDELIEEEFDAEVAATVDRTPRMSDFVAFTEVNSELERQLQTFSEQVAVARKTWSSMRPYVDKFEVDIRRSDQIEKDRDELTQELANAKRAMERSARDLALRVGELAASNTRNSELRAEVEQRRQAALEANSKLNRLRNELAKSNAEVTHLRNEIAKLTADIEREVAAKENAEQSRIELAGKHARLQQLEAQARNKAIETALQNEKLLAQIPVMVAEQENRQNELRAVNRDRGELQNRLMALQDRVIQLESEIQALQSQTASEAYTYRTELEMAQSDLRTAQRAYAEVEVRFKEVQKQLRESEAWRQTSEYEIAALQKELDSNRREFSAMSVKLSDLNLKYMADLVTLDQERDQSRELQQNIEALMSENRRMAKFESLYKASQAQIAGLMGKISLLAERTEDKDLVASVVADEELDIAPSQFSAVNDQPRNNRGEEDGDVQFVAAQ
jgi:chromosome segregation ATPase